MNLDEVILPKHHEVLSCLHLLAKAVPIDQWCLVGGLMVVIAGQLAGASSDRANRTKDGDIVVDVVADSDALARSLRHLRGLGYRPLPGEPPAGDVARCTLDTGTSQIDLLAPDDASEESLELGDGFRSIAIPGGRRALEVADRVTILWGDEGITNLRVPTLYGALAVKAHACVDPRTEGQIRHIQDVAFLLSAIDDPRGLTESLGSDADLLRRLRPRLTDGRDVAWDYLETESQTRAQAVLEFL